jgi:hypothetical protein
MGTKRKSQKPSSQNRNAASNATQLKRAVNWIMDKKIFAEVRLHGNVKWSPVGLVSLALFWVWSDEKSLVSAALDAIDKVTSLFGSAAVSSYQALTGALQSYTDRLLPLLWLRLHGLMEECGKRAWRVGRWLPLAVDGSRLLVPRTEKNEKAFCKPLKQGRKKRRKGAKKRGRHARRPVVVAAQKSHYEPQAVGPQMWLTLIWHIHLRLPWCWRIGPSYSSERGHLLELLEEHSFPQDTLFCADAGFVGYDFWQAIAERGHHFLVRVGGNVRLLKKLGYQRERNGIVYCWPDKAMKQKQPPLVLRLLQFRDRRGIVYLVTNVLNEEELTHAQASMIYRGRWGIEIQFRSLKQTFGRCKLRSRTPETAAVELHWSLLGLWMLQLLAFKEQTAIDDLVPQTSIAAVLRIVRSIMNKPERVPQRGQTLKKQLEAARIDTYERHRTKKSRNYPRRKEEPCTGAPILLIATPTQRENARDVKAYAMAA